MSKNTCFHCGTESNQLQTIIFNEKTFCCNGCKTVYEILNENELTCYYDLESSPGKIPEEIKGKYDYLTNEKVVEKLLEFDDGTTAIITLHIPYIHCSSCIWVLENLQRLDKGISSSQVNFPQKTVRIVYDKVKTDLKSIVELLSSISYEPYISLEDAESGKLKKIDNSLLFKVAVAGFVFGNSMFISFPEYFEVDEFWLNQYKPFFRWILFILSIPVVFYSARDYFSSAIKGLRKGILNIDVPISLGIFVLFMRSTYEIVSQTGQGYFDSLSGLVFFLLIGKFFQQRTYNYLSFERDYKSYFPIAVTKISNKKEESIQIHDVEKGDRLLIRNQELIPIDGVIISGDALIDYSFVTGEANPVSKQSGDKIFAGGKQLSSVIEIEAIKTVSQSYLTQLWSNDIFTKDKENNFKNITDSISKYFTIAILLIALISGIYWLFIDSKAAINVVTAILIIACPCALALSAPFTLGNMLRIFGRYKFYLKNASVIEQMAKVNSLVFDKTGTITSTLHQEVLYNGHRLSDEEKLNVKSILRNSNHPLSRMLYEHLDGNPKLEINNFKEVLGKGVKAIIQGSTYTIGSRSYVNPSDNSELNETAVYVKINNNYKGKFVFKNQYRKGVLSVFSNLSKDYNLSILSGDNEGEKPYLEKILPKDTAFVFNQKPDDKLSFISSKQSKNEQVMMFGDGLNDSGALAQSNVGVSVSENINVFSPACDVIIDASMFDKIPLFLKLAKQSMFIIKLSFVLSFLYNIIGLYFAVSGRLTPIVAAILMPLSSISIVIFVTIMTNLISQKLKK
ncbi:heavy metal translocating P-type ATPase [Urechidicola croceus]|uniref:ATPase n=1 Tax=Urechidicola croceus TaxID=1850246 RepID=A0A1D8P7X3_9FLAO|nr:heavy metal translocating P-type ATPase metal-binding domain-containing protein [Urechidicola croceus]AOW20662.1 ATPase [Urechidicola croceus]